MSIPQIIASLRVNKAFVGQVAAWERLPAKEARYGEAALPLTTQTERALTVAGISRLYRHQAAAISAALAGDNVVIATRTASGKSLCYLVPVIERLINPTTAGNALFLFPTKALAQDQATATRQLLNGGDVAIPLNVYDGDTPRRHRSQIRREGGIVISNPDMVHAGILPAHTNWRDFFRQLRFVIIDEIHAYRGVFGSHVANVLRRLRRICKFYGANPQFICCSATVANPQEHAEKLTGLPFTLVDESQNGAPSGEKQFILYNPPIIDEELGLRQSLTLATRDAAITFLDAGAATAVFARARQTVELLLAYLQDDYINAGKEPTLIRGYRGGYLPLERREIERGLRAGDIQGVVATNALELGIDIGGLEAVAIAGYPGSIAATWQQAGRAGRGEEPSVAMLIAGNGALDQYICRHPRYLFGASPEQALINPDNMPILLNHLACAAYELPFKPNEPFGGNDVDELLDGLADAGILHKTPRQIHYIGDDAPAHQFSLRTSGADSIVIHDISGDKPIAVGKLDLESAPYMAFEGAIYMHQGQDFQILSLDWDGRIAHAQPVSVDYYTRAAISTHVKRLVSQAEAVKNDALHAYGESVITTQATGYRKIRRYTHETLGYGDIDLPEMTLDTMGYWLIFGKKLEEKLVNAGILLAPNDYGANWQTQRAKALERDNHHCQTCGTAARPNQGLHVHHIRPFRDFPPGRVDEANQLDNLVTLCPSCHRRAEQGQQSRSALSGFGYALRNMAPFFLMCDPSDIAVSVENRNPLTRAPTILVYERTPDGVGFSQRLFERRNELLAACVELVGGCRCLDGCPACVGPPGEIGLDAKRTTKQLLTILTE